MGAAHLHLYLALPSLHTASFTDRYKRYSGSSCPRPAADDDNAMATVDGDPTATLSAKLGKLIEATSPVGAARAGVRLRAATGVTRTPSGLLRASGRADGEGEMSFADGL